MCVLLINGYVCRRSKWQQRYASSKTIDFGLVYSGCSGGASDKINIAVNSGEEEIKAPEERRTILLRQLWLAFVTVWKSMINIVVLLLYVRASAVPTINNSPGR